MNYIHGFKKKEQQNLRRLASHENSNHDYCRGACRRHRLRSDAAGDRVVVCRAREAVVHAAFVGLRPCMDAALRDHGDRGRPRLARKENRCTSIRTEALRCSACAERGMVPALLRPALAVVRARRHRSSLDSYCLYHQGVLPNIEERGNASAPLHRMGHLRGSAQRGRMDDEWGVRRLIGDRGLVLTL